ncbi:transcriptional repressor [Agaribacter flavus]|uniref:Ferric uptake regulation protein n=1 Tax=Agaribacter flavus TaxID=1902781 RepID=A0ABV7FST1_9ALTE
MQQKLSSKQQKLVAKAKAYCEKNGSRFTPIREKVYALLLQNEGSIGAYDLLDRLRLTEDSARPPTVYRALDFFLNLGLVHKVESTNTFKACQHFDCSHPVQFLICEQCGDVQEIQSTGVKDTLEAQAAENSFKIKSQTIEAHGVCKKCS